MTCEKLSFTVPPNYLCTSPWWGEWTSK